MIKSKYIEKQDGDQKMNKSVLKIVISLILAVVLALCPCFITGYAATALGDLDADGKINSTDALVVLQFSTGSIKLSSDQKKKADVNGDGKINSTDSLEILKYSTGVGSAYIKPATSDTSYQGTVTASPSLRMRSGPGTGYSILTSIPYGALITITAVSNGWGKTTYNGKTGWVSLDYVSKKTTNPQSGTFTITTYGWGHGVGLSAWGAITYADSGWTYDKILLHYYYSDKTKIQTDSKLPATVKYGGKTYPFMQYLVGSAYAEIGTTCNIEAIKSLVVAIYTFAKYYNFDVSASAHEYKSFDSKGTRLEKAINAVLGKYVSYEGKPILAVYSSSVGGKNTNVKDVWGGADIPYLRGGRVSPEPESITKRVVTFTAEEIKALAKSSLGVNLTGDPSKWFTDIVHDKSISSDTGYIISMKVGGKTIKGDQVRTKLFKYKIRSHCINIKYNP